MKKYLLLSLVIVFVLSGCEKEAEQKQPQSNITAEDEKTMDEIEKKEYKNLTAEEQKIIKKFGAEDERTEEKEVRKLEEDVNLAFELDNLRDEKETGEASKGSCDLIAEGSTCIEYVGSFWTDQQMKLHCGDSGVFSKCPCPSGMAGGCNIGEGTPSDMITWFYLYGGGEITAVSLKNAQNACNSTMMSKWINAR